jgi:hypothetical protein
MYFAKKWRLLAAITLVVASMVLLQSAQPVTRAAALDLGSEIRVLDSYVDDLAAFDNKCALLEKKGSLIRTELDPVQARADDLRRRVSVVESSIRSAITKLKAAGEWDRVDATILARITDAKFQQFTRTEGFRRILEGAGTGLSPDAGQINSRLDLLRSKIGARVQEPVSRPAEFGFVARATPVAYRVAPAVTSVTFRCRVSAVRMGLSYAFSSDPTTMRPNRPTAAYNCFCFSDAASCTALPTL